MKMEGGNECRDCKEDEACGRYHVYVLELKQYDEGDSERKGIPVRRYDGEDHLAEAGGQLDKIRQQDQWGTPDQKVVHAFQDGSGPDLLDLQPHQDEAERKEAVLADDLRSRGFRVKGPRVREKSRIAM